MNGLYVKEEGETTAVSHEGAGHEFAAAETYYRVPAVKRSTYNWMIAASYFSIGTAGASQFLSAILDLSNVHGRDPLVRTGRYAALAGSLITPALYTADLGVSRKWYNMLRIYRSTSLMSVGGAWLLTAFGSTSGATAAGQLLKDLGYEKTGRAISGMFAVPASLLGGFMSVYMGTELEETSTPLWAEVSPLLAPLFAVNNASSALALFELAGDVNDASGESLRPLRFLSLLTETAGIIQLRRIELRWTRSARASALYRTRYDLLYRTGLVTLGKALGLVIRAGELFGGARWRRFRPFASLASLATGYALPTIILYEGNRSADRAEDYFEYTSPVRVEQALASGNPVVKRGRPGPPRKLSIMKWLAVAGLALGAAAVVLRPKKAY